MPVPQLHCTVSLPMFRVVPYRLAVLYLMNCLSGIDFEHRHQSNSNLFYLFKHVSQYNGTSPKSDPQIAAKSGNPAGLLFRRIWYSVGKSGVLGITEYRQGRPLSLILSTGRKLATKRHVKECFGNYRLLLKILSLMGGELGTGNLRTFFYNLIL